MGAETEPAPPAPAAVGAGDRQRYSLRWNDFHACMLSSFRHLRDEEDFVDVTLACDGRSFTAHKVVLSACSPYFRRLLKSNPCQHPIVILRDVHQKDMESLLRFMYNGEVHIGQEHLTDFLKTAQLLQIRGLADVSSAGQRLNTASDNKISPNSTTMIPWVPTIDSHPDALRGSGDSPPPPKRMRSEENNYHSLPGEEHSSPGDEGDLPESLLGQALDSGPVVLKKEKVSPDTSFHAQSTAEDSVSSDGDVPSERTDAATPKTEPPDYPLGLDDHHPYGTNGNISAEQARTPPGFPGSLLGLPGIGGLMAGPSGIHNSQNDFVSRRSLDMMRVRATDPRPCPKCGKIYRSAHTLRTHLEDKHTVCPGYRCVLCGTVAKSRNSLHSHMSRQHRGISTKDLPVLPMPAPFDPELASRLLAKAGVKISPAELRARASPTGPRRSDVKLDAKSAYSGAASETGSSICGENDPEDLTVSQQGRFNSSGQPVAAKSIESLHNLSKEPYPAPLPPPGGNMTGSAILDTYLQFITENSVMAGMMNPEQAAAAMHAAKLAQLNAMGMENHTAQQQHHFMEKMHQDYMMKQNDEIRRGESDMVLNHDTGGMGMKEDEESSEDEYSEDEASGPEGLKAGE